MKKHLTILAVGAAIFGSAFLSSCNKEDEVKKTATINLVHAAPHLPAFGVLDGNDTLDLAINYGSYSGYFDVPAGEKHIHFKMLKQDSAMYTLNTNLPEGKHYSMFLVDSFQAVDSPYKVMGLLMSDDLAVPSNGKAAVRFVHLSPNTPLVDVRDEHRNQVFYPNMMFFDATSFTPIDAGVYNFELCYPNTDSVLAALPTMVFNNQKIYTVYIYGIWGSGDPHKALKANVVTNQW